LYRCQRSPSQDCGMSEWPPWAHFHSSRKLRRTPKIGLPLSCDVSAASKCFGPRLPEIAARRIQVRKFREWLPSQKNGRPANSADTCNAPAQEPMSAGCPPGMIPTVVADITAADFTKPAESLSFYPGADIAIPKQTGGAWRPSLFRRIPWSPDTPRTANQNSKRQPAETVRPFRSFEDVPDQENLFYGLRHRH
jgi:hypothetical protein